MDVLKKHPLAEYIAEQLYGSSGRPNMRDCVRIATMSKTEQDVWSIASYKAMIVASRS
jgi:hypothetical protein